MATGPRLKIDITEKRFEAAGLPLFENLHLDIAPSSTLALIGPSGIGKSTLLRMIAGIDSNFSGSILIDDVPAHAAPTPGFVFQDPRLLPWLNAIDNIRAVSADRSASEAQEALARVALPQSGALFPHQLSGGMQRRVALARALSVNAGLLLLDEPFVSLDRVLVTEMHQLFGAVLTAAHPTVVFVSHISDDAARLADRVILLDHRPARIIADMNLPVPRGERDDAVLAQYRQMLDAHFRESA
jgi:NitT/TauT family transport system ATP-binding protein/sulfonate transport system ATP-binding protein